MHNPSDQFAKNVLRDALSRASVAETEVEVLAATQKIDVYSVPDPARDAERAEMGLLGELSAEPSLFEPYRGTPGLRQVRHCLRKQLTWHHELERRARAAAGALAQDADTDTEAPPQPAVPFPALVVISPGRPETVLEAYRCEPVSPGVYHAVPGLVLRVGITAPLLVHFRLGSSGQAGNEEDDVSAEIQAWFNEYQQQLRSEARKEGLDEGRDEGRNEGRKEGRKEGASNLLLRLLRARFGELPASVVARIEAAETADIEQWGERVLDAPTLTEVLDKPS